MKKSIILLISLIFFSSFSALGLAQQQTSPISKAPSLVPKSKSLTGKVDSVSLADPAKEIRSELLVTDESNKKITFLVKSTTTIYDISWKPVTLDKITKDMLVKVKYTTTKEGVNEATSVKIVK